MTKDEADELPEKHPIVYRSGDPGSENFIEAKAFFVSICRISCVIEITEILQKGLANTIKVGDRKIVSYNNLEKEAYHV